MISLDDLLDHTPLLHDGRTITWTIHPDLARLLDQHLKPGQVTLETGSGLSTLIFLLKSPTRHIAIQPCQDEFVAIKEFCGGNGIATGAFEGVIACSQEYLPGAQLPSLDLVLIDGDHSFPVPFIDWYFTCEHLKVGGIMIVDDVHILTGMILADFMRNDMKWEELFRHKTGRFALYRKLSHPICDGDNWQGQGYLNKFYPAKAINVVKHIPPAFTERMAANWMPWRVQAWLRGQIGWPRTGLNL